VHPAVNPASAITASRLLALPAAAHWLSSGDDQLAFLTILVCALLDLADGAVARRLGCATRAGEVLDAVVDALCAGFFLVLLAADGRLPWLPVGGVLALGAVNAGLRALYAARLGRVANYRSYAMERLVSLTTCVCLLGVIRHHAAYFAWLLLALMALVLARDAKRMVLDAPPAPGEGPAAREKPA
jgi:archaetidylinositol phosphate synthase